MNDHMAVGCANYQQYSIVRETGAEYRESERLSGSGDSNVSLFQFVSAF